MELDLDRIERLAEAFANDPNSPVLTWEQAHNLSVIMNVRPPETVGKRAESTDSHTRADVGDGRLRKRPQRPKDRGILQDMKKFDKDEVLAAWRAKNEGRACPMCGGREWAMQEGWVSIPQSDLLGGPDVPEILPAVAGICTGCAYLAMWSAPYLGLTE